MGKDEKHGIPSKELLSLAVNSIVRKGFQHADAEDACQDACVSVLKKPEQFANARNQDAFFRIAAYRKAIDGSRKRRPTCETDLTLPGDNGGQSPLDFL